MVDQARFFNRIIRGVNTRVSRVALLAALPVAFATSASAGSTIGLVGTYFTYAGPWTADGKTECPAGINPDNRANFFTMFKTPEEQEKKFREYASSQFHNRGPNGESDVYSPETIQDPLPFQDGVGKVSEGFNLDGTKDGEATDKTCKHTKFTSPDGAEAVDNQLWRVFACIRGTRPGGTADGFINMEIPVYAINRWLIEISDVDSEVNDDHVKVMIAKGLDKLVSDGNNGYVSGLSQRVDTKLPEYTYYTTGRIVNGELITDPLPEYRMTGSTIKEFGERRFQNARFRLKLSPTGAEGVLAGYHEVQRYYRWYAKTMGFHGIIVGTSSPSVYASMLRNADGGKDPKTGQCTSISATYSMKFVRAHIVREQPSPEVAAVFPGRSGSASR